MNVLVFGLGRSGSAVAALCSRQGHRVSFFDRRETGDDVRATAALGIERIQTVAGAEVDICIAAPGVPIDHPELRALRARGVETIGEVEWVFRTVPGTFIGVTGTAGKGTTTSWIHHLLQGAGSDAVAGGNLDPALAAVARPHVTMVVELSSFQLERCPSFRPAIAAILNLGSDHLDRHGNVESYHAAKRSLLANLTPEALFVFGADEPLLSIWAHESEARSRSFSTTRPADAWLRPDGRLMLNGSALTHREDLGLRGEHHLANALAAALVAFEMGLPTAAISAGLKDFAGLPGRYVEVATIDTIAFVDDSIATRGLSVEAALQAATAPVVWIAGGIDKGADIESLEPLIRSKVGLMIGIGQAGPTFTAAVSHWTDTLLVTETDGESAMQTAVREGFAFLQGSRDSRGTVLLAPLGASFDQFDDYRHRGRVFESAVNALEAAWTPCC